jgi:hypothetical protein
MNRRYVVGRKSKKEEASAPTNPVKEKKSKPGRASYLKKNRLFEVRGILFRYRIETPQDVKIYTVDPESGDSTYHVSTTLAKAPSIVKLLVRILLAENLIDSIVKSPKETVSLRQRGLPSIGEEEEAIDISED